MKKEKKLISFINNPAELKKVSDDMKDGWAIISLVKNGQYYVGIMEKDDKLGEKKDVIFIPPRKKIKIVS